MRPTALPALLLVASPALGQRPLTAKRLYALCRPSVVRIRTRFHDKGTEMTGLGSGFFFVADDVVATAYHVIRGAEAIGVYDAQGRSYEVRRLVFDKRADVALLRLTTRSKRPPLRPKEFAKVEVGETVYSIGDSLGMLRDSLSQGLVSGKRRDGGVPVVQTTAAISQGNSGGPLLDDEGRVVGIVRGYLAEGQSLNFATSATGARLAYGEKRRWKDVLLFTSENFINTMHDLAAKLGTNKDKQTATGSLAAHGQPSP